MSIVITCTEFEGIRICETKEIRWEIISKMEEIWERQILYYLSHL